MTHTSLLPTHIRYTTQKVSNQVEDEQSKAGEEKKEEFAHWITHPGTTSPDDLFLSYLVNSISEAFVTFFARRRWELNPRLVHVRG